MCVSKLNLVNSTQMEGIILTRQGLHNRISAGREHEAAKNFEILDDLFVKYKSRNFVANKIRISNTALRRYSEHGAVSEFTGIGLSKLLEMDIDYLAGKKDLVKGGDDYRKIEENLRKLRGYKEQEQEQDQEPELTDEICLSNLGDMRMIDFIDYFAEVIAEKVAEKIQR